MGERIAMVCPQRDKGCPWRQFGDPEAKCPTHGKGVRQPNKPYMAEKKKA